MTPLETALQRLPEPAPPEGLSAAIAARIAGHDQRPRLDAAEPTAAATTTAFRHRLPAFLILAGAIIGAGAEAYRLVDGWTAQDLVAPWLTGERPGVLDALPATPAVAVLVAGLLLYLAGLFTPLGAGERG